MNSPLVKSFYSSFVKKVNCVFKGKFIVFLIVMCFVFPDGFSVRNWFPLLLYICWDFLTPTLAEVSCEFVSVRPSMYPLVYPFTIQDLRNDLLVFSDFLHKLVTKIMGVDFFKKIQLYLKNELKYKVNFLHMIRYA